MSHPLAVRILFLTDSFLPHAGGARVYYYYLYRELARTTATEVTILTKKVPGWREFDAAESRPGFRIIRSGYPLPSRKNKELPKIVVPLSRALPLLLTRSFDLVHFGDLYPPGVMSLLLQRTLGLPYVGYCHGEEVTQTDLRRRWPAIRNAIYGGAAMNVAASEFARASLHRIGMPPQRVEKILPGVDLERFRPGIPSQFVRERHGLQGKTVLLTVARLFPRKGHRLVFEAMRRLRKHLPNLMYLIVGIGKEEETLRRLAAEWDLSDAVRFAGLVPAAELPAYYNACDLFVMPNSEETKTGDLEGFGMVFIEANASGKAVIGGRSGGAAEAVLDGRTGLLVDPVHPAELAEAIRLLVTNPMLRDTLAANGLSRAQSEFDWGTRARQLDQLNRKILHRSGEATPAATRATSAPLGPGRKPTF